ncbi:hypothetical protein ACFYUH_37280 [Streptomyces fimicarius]|uniref:hypothetical protein n=1 Tax=Streptomyces griseus TaxID=1911 RepID=UPI0036B92241
MEHRITVDGIETYGRLTGWSEITSIALVREPAVVHDGIVVAQSYVLVLVELVTGDFFEIPQDGPGWNRVLDGLPKHRELRVAGLDDVIAAGEPGETLLWQQTAVGEEVRGGGG